MAMASAFEISPSATQVDNSNVGGNLLFGNVTGVGGGTIASYLPFIVFGCALVAIMFLGSR